MKNDLLLQRSLMPIDREETGTDSLTINRTREINDLKAYGKCVQSNLPYGYTEVEYLESTGTQYIDTGINNWNNTLEFEIKLSIQQQSSGTHSYFGGYDVWTTNGHTVPGISTFTSYKVNNSFTAGVTGSSCVDIGIQVGQTGVYSLKENTILWSQGTSATFNRGTSFTMNNTNIFLFAVNANGNVVEFANTKIYYMKVWLNNVLVRDFTSCRRNSDNVLGMYDKVSGNFLVNSGTGSFIAGPDVVPSPSNPIDIWCNNGVLRARHKSGLPLGYTEVEYIKKTSLSYIDSGINQTNSVGISIDVKFDSYDTGTTYQYASGAYSSGDYIGVWKMYNSSVSLCFVSSIVSVSSSDNTNFHNFKINYLNSRDFSYDNSKVSDITQTKIATSPSIYIGDTNYSQHFGNSSLSIKRVRISNETYIVFDGIPAKTTINGTEVVGLYDTVSGTFKTAKVGTFTAGDPVNDPIEIYTDGLQETINIHGKNLFDKNATLLEGVYNFNNGSWISNVGFRTKDNIPSKPNIRYTMSVSNLQNGANAFSLQAWDSNHQWLGTFALDTNGSNSRTVITGITPQNTAFISISFAIEYRDIDTLQLEQGSTATEYKPYFDGGTATATNLLQVGDYKDIQNIISGDITRRVGIKVLDGTEDWNLYTSNNGFTSFYIEDAADGVMNGICSHFKYYQFSGVSLNRECFAIGGITNKRIFIVRTNDYITSSLKQWLADQYNAGTPVIVVYPLATPTQETVEGQHIDSQIGANIIDVSQASLGDLNFKVRYRQK